MTAPADVRAPAHRINHSQRRYSLPEGARQIVLVRHGSTGGEVVNRLQLGDLSISDPALLPEGHVQAEAVAQRLRHEPIRHIFATPLQRTQQTAAPLVELLGIEPVVIDDLRETHLGDFEHDFSARAAAGDPLLKRMHAEETWDVIPNAETMAAFAARVRRGIEVILGHVDAGSTAVAFAHGGTIAEVCRQATGARGFSFLGPENTSISRLVVLNSGRWVLRGFNDVAHLPPHHAARD
jgi:probable phosphoglycerate mutase